MNTTDIHWLAGMIEGEGYIGVMRGHGTTPALGFSSTDFDIAVRVAALFKTNPKGYSPRNPKHKINFRVEIMGRKAIGWMFTLYPILGHRRREKIREAVETWRRVPNRAKRGDLVW